MKESAERQRDIDLSPIGDTVNALAGKKLPPHIHKEILKTSNVLKDQLDRALRLVDKDAKMDKLIQAIEGDKWPTGVAKFGIKKDVPEQDMPLPTDLCTFSFFSLPPGSSMREARTAVFEKYKLYELKLERQLSLGQLENVKGNISSDAFIRTCSSYGAQRRSNVEELSLKIGVPIPDTLAQPNEGLTKAACESLYAKIFDKVAADVQKRDSKVEEAKKQEQKKIEKDQ